MMATRSGRSAVDEAAKILTPLVGLTWNPAAFAQNPQRERLQSADRARAIAWLGIRRRKVNALKNPRSPDIVPVPHLRPDAYNQFEQARENAGARGH
jgi:hypothetical protein